MNREFHTPGGFYARRARPTSHGRRELIGETQGPFQEVMEEVTYQPNEDLFERQGYQLHFSEGDREDIEEGSGRYSMS